jgi:Tfp pilus assembly protein PilF
VTRYGVKDVERLLRLPRSTIRALITAGFVSPERGPRNSWLFSFQDLIVLRTAQALADARIPQRRITRSVKELRKHLPESMPLSGLSIGAVGDSVVVKEGGSQWQAESGQYLLGFDRNPADGSLAVIERAAPNDAAGWFARGLELERHDKQGAMTAYAKAIAADTNNLDARLNLGLLLHQSGRLKEARDVYAEALEACGQDPVLLFNVAVLLEDLNRRKDAVKAYQAALYRDPALADAHYNVALLLEKMGRPKDALRHMSEYRRLTASGAPGSR